MLKSAVIAIPAQSDLGRLAEVSHQFSRAFRALSGRATATQKPKRKQDKNKDVKKSKRGKGCFRDKREATNDY